MVGMYLLNQDFFDYLDSVEEWEYQFEDALSELMQEERAAVLEVDKETNSLKYPWDLFDVVEELLSDQERDISGEADIAESADIKGRVVVEESVKVHENAVIKGPAYIGENCVVGNNALIRDLSVVEENSTIGANAEVTRSVFQPGSSMHSGFVGDSIIGRNVSIGAGAVLANRMFRRGGERPTVSSELLAKGEVKDTGRKSMGAVIGDGVDIGSNSVLMPGVQVGAAATIGPGTLVKDNVKNGETVYVNQEQVRRE